MTASLAHAQAARSRSSTVEAARIALRQAGPASGLYGPAAACMDEKLADVAAYLVRVAEHHEAKEREARG